MKSRLFTTFVYFLLLFMPKLFKALKQYANLITQLGAEHGKSIKPFCEILPTFSLLRLRFPNKEIIISLYIIKYGILYRQIYFIRIA